jgi:uncharacterized membrane protein
MTTPSSSRLHGSSSRLHGPAWGLLLGGAGGVLGLALLPPFVSPAWRAVLMNAFAPVCHQLPARSPFLGGVQIAICDRCAGIYLGVVLGVATVAVARRLWRAAGRHAPLVLLGSLGPLGVDWVGPLIGLWPNTPLSRAATGLVFGIAAGSFAAARLLRGAASMGAPPDAPGPAGP